MYLLCVNHSIYVFLLALFTCLLCVCVFDWKNSYSFQFSCCSIIIIKMKIWNYIEWQKFRNLLFIISWLRRKNSINLSLKIFHYMWCWILIRIIFVPSGSLWAGLCWCSTHNNYIIWLISMYWLIVWWSNNII